MDPDFAQRRRLAVAAAITVIIVPAAFLLNRPAAGDSAAIVTAPEIVAIPNPDAPPANSVPVNRVPANSGPAATDLGDDPLGTFPPDYPQASSTPTTVGTPMIAIPRGDDAERGEASFERDITPADQCIVAGAPTRARVTVTNLDNSRSVQCVNASVAEVQPAVVMLSAESFALIAELTDAPIPVEFDW